MGGVLISVDVKKIYQKFGGFKNSTNVLSHSLWKLQDKEWLTRSSAQNSDKGEI